MRLPRRYPLTNDKRTGWVCQGRHLTRRQGGPAQTSLIEVCPHGPSARESS